ncbi:MAG TPA: helix-turn-helix transcriptional regulator [Candidatus Scubalenecus merdavium]|uniref:Helix-turn-helix transcriptional regulator n=1 Tax=Candidatus Scybalenecus merdavium TaxID=2840939 RepID=A0A9D1MTJ8_9FIRM|nr:helix-turn-helix transcriptional regulator [Candidatus Scubalenecus merdavium]
MTGYIQLGKTLKTYRKANHLSQQQVADILRIGRATYARYEGETRPSYELLVKLSRLYGVTTDQLLSESTEGKPSGLKVCDAPDVEKIRRTDTQIINLTEFEQYVLMKTRMMNFDDKTKLLHFINELCSEDPKN